MDDESDAAKSAQENRRLVNARIFDLLATSPRGAAATDAINDFTRARMREDGFLHRSAADE